MDKYGITIGLGILFGTMARAYMLKSDYRRYPGYPHGFVTHLSLGFIAAALGAVALPAMAEREYTAVTFLALAAQQFRDVRHMERESLAALEDSELVPRGKDYIEGIARVFESRNYLVMATALLTSGANFFTHQPLVSVIVGFISIYITGLLKKGQVIGQIAVVEAGTLHFEGALLKVNEIDIMNVGLPRSRQKILLDGLGVVIHPKDDNGRATLHSMGQRQAMVNVITTVLGTKKDIDTPEFTPMARKNIDIGSVALFCIPAEKDIDSLIAALERVPVLESAQRLPLKTKAGRIAAD